MLASKVKCPKCGKIIVGSMGLGRIRPHECVPEDPPITNEPSTDYVSPCISAVVTACEMLIDDKSYSMQDLGCLDNSPADSSYTDIGGGGDFGGGGSSGDW